MGRYGAKQYHTVPPTNLFQSELRLGAQTGLSFTTFIDEGLLRQGQEDICRTISDIFNQIDTPLIRIGHHIILDSKITDTWTEIDNDLVDEVRASLGQYEDIIRSNKYISEIILPGIKIDKINNAVT
jgi:hypothetical protein